MMVSSGVYFGILWGWSKMEKEKHEITSKGTKLSCVRLRASVRSGYVEMFLHRQLVSSTY